MEIRSYKEAPKANERKVSGYALVFGQESRVMYDQEKKRFFIEIIEPGAVDQDLIARSDVKAVFNHNEEMLLARSVNGVGSLQLSVDDYGLKYEYETPNTQAGNDTLELVNRRDVTGSSFKFVVRKENQRWDFTKEIPRCYIRKIDDLFDVSPVIDPAYMGTDVSSRSLTDAGYKGGVDKLDEFAKQEELFKEYLR